MDIKRRIGLSVGLLTISLGTGHVLQNRAAEAASVRQQSNLEKLIPTDITPLVAEASILPDVGLFTQAGKGRPGDLKPAAVDGAVAGKPSVAAIPGAAPGEVADACPVRFDLVLRPNAMIGLSLQTPCHAGERVVLRHAGLAFTARTSVNGALFLTLPALSSQAEVSVLFADATTADAVLPVPDMNTIRRFGVQWTAADDFQIHAFEAGADYGAAGHVWAGSKAMLVAGKATDGGFLTQLGDARVPLPMLAQVYTYPADPLISAELVIEAAITPQTCDRELLGETLSSVAGKVAVTDLIVAMPGCDAVGDILVLKNVAPGPTVTAAK